MYHSMTKATVLPFRNKDRFSRFLGIWRHVFESPLAPVLKVSPPVYIYVLAFFLVLGQNSVAAQSSTAEEALEAQAYIWMQRGRADKAAESWRKLLLSQPQNATALSELAVHAVTLGVLSEAKKRLSELQEVAPNDSRLAFVRAIVRKGDQVAVELRKARAHSKAGRSEAALQHYWKAFGETVPTTLAGLEYFQVLEAATDGWKAAHTGLERLAELYPKAAHVQLAFAIHLTYMPTTRIRGIQLLLQLTEIPAVSNQARDGWRQAVLWLGESPQALPWLRTYVNANPQDNELLRRLEQLEPRITRQKILSQAFEEFKAGNLDQAEKMFNGIPGAEQDPEALVGLASIALTREDFDKAVKLLYQARDLAPQRTELWQQSLQSAELWQEIKRANALRRDGRLDEAQTILERAATSTAAERYQAVLALVEVLLERNNITRAQYILQELLTSPPNDATCLRRLVSLLLRANLNEEATATNEALRTINASAAFRPEGLQAERLRLQAIALRRSGDVIAARDVLVTATGLDPRASQVWLDLINLDIEIGDLDEAQRSVKVLLKAKPVQPEAVLIAARLAELRGEYEYSLELLSTITIPAYSEEIDILRKRLALRLAAARAVRTFRIGGVSAARMQLSELARTVSNSTTLGIVAEAWAEIGEIDQAMLLLNAGENASVDLPSVRLQIAALLLRAGRTGETMIVLDKLAAQSGLSPAELLALQKLRIGCVVRIADSLRLQGDIAGARSELAPWAGAHPIEPQIANAYGRVLHDAGDYEAAAKQFDRVLKVDPGNFDALQGLAYATLSGGTDLNNTRQTLQQGLQVRGEDPRLHLYIARLDTKTENYKTALEELALANRIIEDEIRSEATFISKEKMTTRSYTQSPQSKVELEQLRSEIQSETQRVRAAAGTKIIPEFKMRSRQGNPGREALFELTSPSRLEIPNSWGTLSLQVSPTHLSAGQLVLGSGTDTVPFGTIEGVFSGRDIKAEGVALGVEYRYRGWQLDIGVTPLNFARLNFIGGLRWKKSFHDLSLILEASRRAVEESVLSFSGATDPGSGLVWGGVVKQGGAVTLRYDGRNSRSYAILDYQYLTGTNVKSNHSLAAHLGLRWELKRTRSTNLETGLAVSAMAFERNLSQFSYGHGGYFSPQRFLHFGLPIDWRGSYQAVMWQLTLEPGVTWFQLDEAPYYPLAKNTQTTDLISRYPSRRSLGLGVDGGLELGYTLTPQITLGARAELHTGNDYREICASTFLRFALKGSDGSSRED